MADAGSYQHKTPPSHCHCLYHSTPTPFQYTCACRAAKPLPRTLGRDVRLVPPGLVLQRRKRLRGGHAMTLVLPTGAGRAGRQGADPPIPSLPIPNLVSALFQPPCLHFMRKPGLSTRASKAQNMRLMPQPRLCGVALDLQEEKAGTMLSPVPWPSYLLPDGCSPKGSCTVSLQGGWSA